jgi:hypothetical protein
MYFVCILYPYGGCTEVAMYCYPLGNPQNDPFENDLNLIVENDCTH